MTQLTVDIEGAKQTAAALGATAKEIPRIARSAINKTATKTRREMASDIKAEVAIQPAMLNRVLKVRKRARQTDLRAVVGLDYQKRLSLKAFGARHVRQGVSYRISKRGGRKLVPGGFMGPKPGRLAGRLNGHPYIRTGRRRLPIRRLDAVSPWGVYKANRMEGRTKRKSAANLANEIRVATDKVIAKRKLR